MSAAPLLIRITNRLRRISRRLRCLGKQLTGQRLHIHIQNQWRLGDEIMALPFYRLVRERYPHARMTVSVNHPELLTGRGDIEVVQHASEFDCDRYMFIQHDPRSRNRTQYLCKRFRIPYRILEPQIPIEDVASDGHTDRVRVAYSCGAGWTCKSAPVTLLRETLSALAERYTQLEFIELGKGCPSAGVGQSFIDRCTIKETAELLSRCRLYIGPDSGLVHLALAVGTPTIGLYGPVKPLVAFGHRTGLFPIKAKVSCQGCWTAGRMYEPGQCPRGHTSDDPEDYPCMGSLKAEDVLAKIEKIGIFESA